MPVTAQDIETPRSPRELVQFIDRVTACVRSNPAERIVGSLRRGCYKEFLDEVVPLARFCVRVYEESDTIQPVLGNQGFDAIVKNANGQVIDKVEIANPIDGARVSRTAREVAEHGAGGFGVSDPGDEVADLIPIIERTAVSKAAKDYSDTTVVFNLSALPPIQGFETKHTEQINHIRSVLAQAGFNARRVYLLHPPDRLDRIDA